MATSDSRFDPPLALRSIRLGVTAADKTAAIRAVGELLVDGGYIEPGYIESMLAREQRADTCLGRGVAVPRGRHKDRGLVKKSGLAVVQIPAGVRWNDKTTVTLVVGLATRNGDHRGFVASLMSVFADEAVVRQLATTTDAREILVALSRAPPAPAPTPPSAFEDAWPDAVHVEVAVCGQAGLHTRRATRFAEIATEFYSDVRVRHGDRVANGKAVASLLRLGAESGVMLRIEARGADAGAALAILREAVENGFDDADEYAADSSDPPEAWTPPENVTTFIVGTPASPGVAIGPLFHYRTKMLTVEDTGGEPAAERARLGEVLAKADAELQHLSKDAHACPLPVQAEIFEAHQALLADPDLFADVVALIDEGHAAPWSWQQVIGRRVKEVRSVKNERLAGRATDLLDIGQRVLRLFSDDVRHEPALPSGECILVADDLTPSDTAHLDLKKIIGLCTAAGGPTSHTAIIARARGLPAVVAAGEKILSLPAGAVVILDGGGGRLYPNPDDAAFASAKEFQARLARQQAIADADRFRPAVLTDGHRVEIAANICGREEAAAAVEAGAEGVGLLRTEFLFLCRETAPTEEEQFTVYSEVIRELDGLPLIIRAFDIGGDKIVPYLGLAPEENPFLGMRGIRLCLRRSDVFKTQLRAIYRAVATAGSGTVKIMFPMVATLEELIAAKEIAESVRAQLGAPVCELGIMIEVPSAAIMAREFAREADFFSIGTNDLTQYALAIDREHPELGKDADALHPAVLRLVEQTVGAATAAGKWVGVCGGAAGEPLGAMILTGLGVSELSMGIPSLAVVKARLRDTSFKALQGLAQRALACSTAAEVRSLSTTL